MHPLGADLQLDPLMARADDGGVDRLVVVLLRIGDVVLEAAGHRVPARVHHGQRAVTVLDLGHDNAEGVDVGELLERDLLPLHLAPNSVGLFLATRHDARDMGLFELRGERRLDLVDQALVALAQDLEALDHGRIGLGVERLEGMVLELLAQPLHAHAPGERRIDVHGLLGDDLALLRLHMLERAHVVQAVGELDQQHADVAGDGEQELAEVLRLLGLLGDEVEFLDLGQAVDQRADLASEQRVDLAARGGGVLDRVVQQRGGDGRVVEPHLGEDRRDLDGMGEIGRAGRALLVAMRLHGVDIGAVEQRLVGVRLIAQHALDQLVLTGHGAARSAPAVTPAKAGIRSRQRKSA